MDYVRHSGDTLPYVSAEDWFLEHYEPTSQITHERMNEYLENYDATRLDREFLISRLNVKGLLTVARCQEWLRLTNTTGALIDAMAKALEERL